MAKQMILKAGSKVLVGTVIGFPEGNYSLEHKLEEAEKAIKEIQVYTNSRLKVILPTYKDDEVIVSREKVQDFKAWLG